MLRRKRLRYRWLQPIAGILLAVIVLEACATAIPSTLFTSWFQTAEAAQVTIDAAVSTAQLEHLMLGSQSVFTTDQIGYKFYVDSTGGCVYSKSTNGGTSWGTAVTVDSQTDCFGISVWYDQWTPGDSGNFIHIMTADPGNDDVWYNRLDVTDDSRLLNAAPVSAVINTGQTGTIAAGSNAGSITKGTDGTIYIAMNDNTDRYVVECSTNCGVSTSWTETGVTPMDAQPDYSLLMPLSGGDILLINRDIDADDMRSKVWDDSAGSWSGAWTTIDASSIENNVYEPGFAATINTLTGDIFLAYIDNATGGTIGGNNDDIRTAVYSGSWTATGDVVTNSALGITHVTLGFDALNGDIYVGYGGRTTPATATTGNVYWKQSTNDMVSWGAQQGPVNTTPDDLYGIDINSANYERLYISWYGITPDDMFGDTLVDLVPPVIVSVDGIQTTEVRASTTDFYVGGTFVIKENLASRNVTEITISETGTVNAASALDNIELRYDLDTSAPYDCESESYSGSEGQFGSTDIDGFSGANGTSTFTDSIAISPTQAMCVYAVLDVLKSAAQQSTLDIEITNPVTDVIVSGGVEAVPDSIQALPSDTIIKLDTDYKVQRGISTITGNSLTITAGVDYETPVSSSSAFIRITNTGYTGAGRNSGGGTSNTDDTTVYISNPENITNSITFTRGVGAVNNTRVSWEIIEYKGPPGGENEIIVRRHQNLTYVSGNLSVTSTAIPSVVNDNDVAVFLTAQYNPSTGSTVWHRGFSTAAWNAGTNQVTLTRGATGDAAIASYAVIEFTGSNWNVQRVENTYAAVGLTEIEAMTAVNSLSRTFLHVQKRFPASTHANFGHEVWLSGIGQVSFLLDGAATTPASHVSVAWVIENTQTEGTPLVVTRSNGTFTNTGAAPQANQINIGTTLDDLLVASLFVNNRSDTITNTWPEPILGARLLSTTQYELWRSDTGANIAYRTEVVEWPTAERKLEQNYYRLYVNNDAVLPTDPWPAGAPNLGENTEMTGDDVPLALGDVIRIRMTVAVEGAAMPIGLDSFDLEYAPRVTSCTAVANWLPVGEIGSSTALWRGFNNTPADGTALSTDPPTGGDLLITFANIAGTYEEENSSALNPYLAFPGDHVEYDWVVQHNGAADKTDYCFRMIESNGTEFSAYNNYPLIKTVGYEPRITNWRWYDDETSLTPAVPLAGENIAPNNIANQNALKLRLVLKESSSADGFDTKFALQVSEYADFSTAVFTVVSTSTCVEDSTWCYFDGAGTDNAIISSAVISNADSCVAGVGAGCGTYNEGISTTTATHDQLALTSTEYEFTVLQAAARVNAVYYFRLFDVVNNEIVGLDTGASYPSLVIEGPQLVLSTAGLPSGTVTAGITTDVTTTASAVAFGTLAFNTSVEAAQRITVDTNATEGYQLLQYARQQLMNSYGDIINPVTGTNSAPSGWNTGCDVGAAGCFGYHSTDATLFAGSGRFGPTDSYAALATNPEEVMYSTLPVVDVQDIVYRIRVNEQQVAGDYETDIVYIAVPVF